ncbi:MAG: choice-of-anchor D domain-containing protein [bacterium]|nr:choice-of-anchor D domain-containing protein [bacterium]
MYFGAERIVTGSETPAAVNGTDFGSADIVTGAVKRTFVVTNTDSGALVLTGVPAVAITGPNASDFAVTAPPADSLVSGASTPFDILFSPSAEGIRTAMVTIASSDADDDPFSFAIQGEGTVTWIAVSGRVTDGAVPLEDAVVVFSHDGHVSLTDADGTYSHRIPAGRTTVLTPEKAGYAEWTPASIILNGLLSDTTGIDFMGSPPKNAEADVTVPTGSPVPSGGTLDFGTLAAGMDTAVTLAVRNGGNGVLTLALPLIPGGSDAFQVVSQPSGAVDPGAETFFTVRFSPSSAGAWNASLAIGTNDADENPYHLYLTGAGEAAPETAADPGRIGVLVNGIPFADGAAYDFGSEPLVTFTLVNTGGSDLAVGTPLSVSGDDAAHFLILNQPESVLPPGGKTELAMRFRPLSVGLKTAFLVIANNDPDAGRFILNLQGTGISAEAASEPAGGSKRGAFQLDGLDASASKSTGLDGFAPLSGAGVLVHDPEIMVTGNSVEIASGDATPSATDSTDLGSVEMTSGVLTVNYSIRNAGTSDLSLTGSPRVTLSGANASDFTVTLQPSSPVAPGSTVLFSVRFDPSATGVRTAVISISNDDVDDNEDPYTFSIRGTGVIVPEMSVSGNGLTIASGDGTPETADGTDFGDVQSAGSVTVSRTFTISNSGSDDLNLSGSPYVSISGTNASEFTVTVQPSTPVAAGGSVTFTVEFDPSAIDLRTALVTIHNNDPDENPYTFAIQGTGTSSGNPIPCMSRFFHIYETNGSITYLDPSTNPYSYITIRNAGYTINAVGYNYEDGFMYAIERGSPILGDRFIRIDEAGNITNMRAAPWLGWVGDCDLSGNLYVINDAGTAMAVYDISANTVTTRATSGPAFLARDMAFRTQDGYFWGVYGKQLYRFNGSTGQTVAFSVTGSLADDYDAGINNGTWGATWTASDGFLYAGNNQSGRLYRINVSSGESVYIGTGVSGLNNNDGASCPLAPAPFPSTGYVGNYVWIDQDNDGIQDSAEPGMSGVTVTLYTSGGASVASTVTDADGAYSFSGIAVGQYSLRFTGLPAGFSFAQRDQGSNDRVDSDADASGVTEIFSLSAGEIKDFYDVGVRTTGIGDRVWEDTDNDGIQDAGELGVPGVLVRLYTSGNVLTASTTTNSDGFYYFGGLTAGSWYYVNFNGGLPGGYVIGRQNRGTNDDLDSDPAANTGNTENYQMTANTLITNCDAAIRQTTFPEIEVRGNNVVIADGDATPSVTDSTEFGSVSATLGTVRRTFTIRNTGAAALTLYGTPRVEIGGTNAADFSVVVDPAASVASGGSTTFQVRFDPSGIGLRSATITIYNNDSNEDPYNFSIQGTGLAPEMDVQGNGVSITDGDGTPSLADHTEFGSQDILTGQIDRTFTIRNTGTEALSLTGSTRVQITGAHAADFSVVTQPASGTVAVGGTATFVVGFNPSATGLRSAEITIANTDPDENPYNFSIQGTGTAVPEMDVRGNAVSIADGDASPSVSDSTDFGSGDILNDTVTRTYTIFNTGSADLSLTGAPRVEIIGANAGDFLVSQQPSSSSVPAGGGSLTFKVTFNPTLTGVRQAEVRIYNTDSNENPYNFSIQGTGTAAPEISVSGLDIEIASGDAAPSAADNTDFGSAGVASGTVVRAFKIRNTGSAALNLTGGSPYVQITGTHAEDFTVTQIPEGSVDAAGDSTEFRITFNPSATGLRTAGVSIASDDSDENPYTFAIQGTGVGMPQLVLSKSVNKASALPGDELTYTIGYENIGDGNATAVTVLETVPSHTTFITGSVTASGMNVTYSHNNGASYDASDSAPVTHIRFQRPTALAPAESGEVTFKVRIQ